MFLSSKRRILIPAFIALVVIFDTQSVHCRDLEDHQTTTDNEPSHINQVRSLKSEKSSKRDRKSSESDKDYSGSKGDKISKKSKSEDEPKKKLVGELEGQHGDITANYANLRGSPDLSSVEENDEDYSNWVLVGEVTDVKDDTIISGRTVNVLRPSTILGGDPTLQPSPAPGGNIVRPGGPGTSYYAEDTPAPVFVANTQNTNNIPRPGGTSSTSFAYPTVAPTYSPVNKQPVGIPVVYFPRPESTSSWADNPSQSYQADRPTPMPTPYPTTFPPVYNSAGNAPVARSGSLLLPESPSHSPSDFPSVSPSGAPSSTPTLNPTPFPTLRPTKAPTNKPSRRPTRKPTDPPTWSPTEFPSMSPKPSPAPSRVPTRRPTSSPTGKPSVAPSDVPSGMPTTRAGTLVRPSSSSASSYFTKRPTVSPTTAGATSTPTVDSADNATVADDDTLSEYPTAIDEDGNVTRSTSAPSSSFVSQSDAEVAKPTSVPQNDAEEARPTIPTWQPTTWLPTVTYHPTNFIYWGRVGRNEDSNATSDEEYEGAEDTPAIPSDSNTTSDEDDYNDDGCCGRWGGDIEACSINPICNTNQDRCEMLPQCSGNWLSNSDDEPHNSD
jgi:hypothetical protein